MDEEDEADFSVEHDVSEGKESENGEEESEDSASEEGRKKSEENSQRGFQTTREFHIVNPHLIRK